MGGLGGPIESRVGDLREYKKSGNKCKKELKTLKNQNKILYSISKKSGSHRELKNINKIKDKASKKRRNYISDEYYYGFYLYRNSN